MIIFADEPWVKYVIDTFLSLYSFLKQEKKFNIFYDKKAVENGIVILKGKKCKKILEFNNESIPIFHANSSKDIKGKIIASYNDGSTAIIFNKSKNIIYVDADILKTSFLIISGMYENETLKDSLGRFQAKYAFHDDFCYPIVNVYFNLLYKLVLKLIGNDFVQNDKKSHWPNSAPYAVCLTHDVDNVYKWWPKKILSYIFKKRRISEIVHSIGKREYWNFEKIMNLESKFGFKSTFFFLVNKRDLQPRYNIKKLRNIIKILDGKGWEIGLHTGLYSYNCFDRILNEKKKLENILGSNISGVRNHFLRIKLPETWFLQSEAGFTYDTTIGFRENIGFRSGFCHPYKSYDYNINKNLKIFELPMNIMDSALLSIDKPKEKLKKLIQNVKKHNGLIVINWHQCSFDDKDYHKRVTMYKYILQQFKLDNAYVDTCNNITQLWKNIND